MHFIDYPHVCVVYGNDFELIHLLLMDIVVESLLEAWAGA